MGPPLIVSNHYRTRSRPVYVYTIVVFVVVVDFFVITNVAVGIRSVAYTVIVIVHERSLCIVGVSSRDIRSAKESEKVV